jgi:6-pyruvoyltetrahydropterin/6-carboxytetrahydropterin synthase
VTTSVSITRRATFAAAHILCRPEWTEERNREVFGLCTNDHGHNYVIEVTIRGPVDESTGMVINLKQIDGILRRELIDAVDHRHLNRDVDFLKGIIPTTENIAQAAFDRLAPHFRPAELIKVRLVESENNSAEVTAG